MDELLAHEISGAGPELVLVHGITESRRTWDPLIDTLSRSHRVLAVDLPGHGESAAGASYDPISLAAAVHNTVEAVGFATPVLVGHSLGGVVVSAYAAAFGAGVRGVVNIDQPLQLSLFQAQLQEASPMLRGSNDQFRAFMTAMFASMDGSLRASERARINNSSRPDQQVVLALWAAVLDTSPAELNATVDALAGAVHVPYFALHGIDPGPAYPAWLTSLVASATVEVWPGVGHYPHLVETGRFVARLASFEQNL